MENPTKHLVYRPTAMQLLSILTTTVEVLPKEAVLLLYASAHSSAGATAAASNALARGATFPSTSCLTSEIAPAGDGSDPQPDNMSDVSTVGGGGVRCLVLGPGSGWQAGQLRVHSPGRLWLAGLGRLP